jgi:formylglycine-generating enzyme
MNTDPKSIAARCAEHRCASSAEASGKSSAAKIRSPICVHPCRSVVAAVLALLCLLAFPSPAATNATPAQVPVPAGIYRPQFRGPDDLKEVPVAAFQLDLLPVTNSDYLDFVRANPRWRRSQVKRLFADENYLRHWAGDLDLGTNTAVNARQPVTWVSWFAAKAFARWRGGRLPTNAEWEFAASAGFTRLDGTNDLEYRRMVAAWYARPSPAVLPKVGAGRASFYGVHDLHGLVWEWTSDFNNALVTGDSRGDTGIDRQLFCGAGAQSATDRTDFQAFMRYGFRSSLKAAYTVHNLGFRCAYDGATTNAPSEKTP